MIEMIRTFHPVGHGAFYTERFYNRDENRHKPIFTVVFDCGCFEVGKKGVCSAFFENQINNAVDQEFSKDDVIDLLFISHFHTDHINGIKYLLKMCQVKRVVIPVLTPRVILEAYVYNYITTQEINNHGNLFIQRLYRDANGFLGDINVTQIQSLSYRSRYREREVRLANAENINRRYHPSCVPFCYESIWEYIPFNLLNGQVRSLLYKDSPFKRAMKRGKIDFEQLQMVIEEIGIEGCQKMYKKVFKDKHNSYSMTVLSNNKQQCRLNSIQPTITEMDMDDMQLLKCLYMGDFEASDTYPGKNMNLIQLKLCYARQWSDIELLQVPHHGSEHNYNKDLYDRKRVCVISAGATDIYGHPDQSVITWIRQNNCIPIVVTEQCVRTNLRYRINA